MDNSKVIDPAVLLDKVARLYPAGIPRHLVRAPREEPAECNEPLATTQGPKALFIAVAPRGTLPQTDADFLASVASKGMKLGEAEYHVCITPDVAQGEAQVAALSVSMRPRVVVLFGAAELSGPEWLDKVVPGVGRVAVVRCPELSHLASNGDAKRSFWKVLQGVLPHITSQQE